MVRAWLQISIVEIDRWRLFASANSGITCEGTGCIRNGFAVRAKRQDRCASFDVALVQARRASECISMGFVMHLLAPRACIENALRFEIPGEIK